MKIFNKILIIFMLISSPWVCSAQSCRELFDGTPFHYSDEVSDFYIFNSTSENPTVIRDFNRTELGFVFHNSNGEFTLYERILQEMYQYQLLGQLLWRLQSPMRTLKILNSRSIEEGYWRRGRPFFEMEFKNSVQLKSILTWLYENGERPAVWLTQENAMKALDNYNRAVYAFHSKLTDFASEKVIQNRLFTHRDLGREVPSLDIILRGQRSLLENDHSFMSIDEHNTFLTIDGELILLTAGS